jgi:hypothetical protein
MPAKILAAHAGAAAGASRGEKGGCGREEGDGREEGAAAPLEVLQALLLVVKDRVASDLCRLFARLYNHISQQTLKITDRVSVIRPHNRKGLTFVGQGAVGRQRPRHGVLNALEEAPFQLSIHHLPRQQPFR